MFIKIGRLQTVVLLPVILGFVFLGEQFILIWTPNGYNDAYIIALLLMAPATIPYIQNAGIAIQTAKNKHQFRALLYTIMALINFVISILLCKKFGGVGCAIGTAISILVANILIMNIYYHKYLNLNMIRFWKEETSFIPSLLILSVVGILIKLFVPITNYLMLIECGIMFMVVYLATLWLFALDVEEKDMISSMIGKKRN